MDEKSKKVVDISLGRVLRGEVEREIKKAKRMRCLKYIFSSFILAFLLVALYLGYDPDVRKPNFYGQVPETSYNNEGDILVTLKQDEFGHYIFVGEINGVKVDFLLDTGATRVSVPKRIANFIGLPYGESYYSNTANGKSLSYGTVANIVTVGGISLFEIEASISTGMEGDEVLLGMSFLKNLEIIQKNGEIVLKGSSFIIR